MSGVGILFVCICFEKMKAGSIIHTLSALNGQFHYDKRNYRTKKLRGNKVKMLPIITSYITAFTYGEKRQSR